MTKQEKKKLLIEKVTNTLTGEKKVYRLPVSWEVYSFMDIEASSLQEAVNIAHKDDTPLPTDSDYVDGSFKVETDILECDYPDEPITDTQ